MTHSSVFPRTNAPMDDKEAALTLLSISTSPTTLSRRTSPLGSPSASPPPPAAAAGASNQRPPAAQQYLSVPLPTSAPGSARASPSRPPMEHPRFMNCAPTLSSPSSSGTTTPSSSLPPSTGGARISSTPFLNLPFFVAQLTQMAQYTPMLSQLNSNGLFSMAGPQFDMNAPFRAAHAQQQQQQQPARPPENQQEGSLEPRSSDAERQAHPVPARNPHQHASTSGQHVLSAGLGSLPQQGFNYASSVATSPAATMSPPSTACHSPHAPRPLGRTSPGFSTPSSPLTRASPDPSSYICDMESYEGPPEQSIPSQPSTVSQSAKRGRSSSSGALAKKFTCTICCRGFTTRGNLTVHLRSHSGVKRFRCEVCHKGFTRKATARQHLQSQHLQPSARTGDSSPPSASASPEHAQELPRPQQENLRIQQNAANSTNDAARHLVAAAAAARLHMGDSHQQAADPSAASLSSLRGRPGVKNEDMDLSDPLACSMPLATRAPARRNHLEARAADLFKERPLHLESIPLVRPLLPTHNPALSS